MDQTTAFVRSDAEGEIEIVVNFGPLSGREATQAEVDRLARRLLATAEEVRVHAVRTHDMSRTSESIVYFVCSVGRYVFMLNHAGRVPSAVPAV